MVPSEKILLTPIEQNVDVIGLMRLITPSLEEMVHGCKKRCNGWDFLSPYWSWSYYLWDSIQLSALISSLFGPGFIHVRDASRSAGVYIRTSVTENKKAYGKRSETSLPGYNAGKYEDSVQNLQFVSLREAVKTGIETQLQRRTWSKNHRLPVIKYFYDFPLAELKEYIDWTFFFHAGKWMANILLFSRIL